MNLTLVAIHIEPSARAMPLGPAMLAAALNRELGGRVATALLDGYLGQGAEEIAGQILAQEPDGVGFSMVIWNRSLALEVVACLRARAPQLVIFAGGPEPTTNPEGLVGEGVLDFVLPGECERSIVAAVTYLLEGGAPTDMPASIQKLHVDDLTDLPSPFLERTLNLADYSGVLWELSRGCPYRCDFCYESRGTAGIRRFPMDRVRDELRLFVEAGVEQVFVLDPTFNFDRKAAKEVLRLIAAEAPDIYFCFEIRSEFIDADMAALFAAIPCSLQIGLQSASNDVLQNVNRTIDGQDVADKMLLLYEAGAVYGFDLIYGLPGDNLEGFCRSIDFAMQFVPNHLDMFPLAVLPGTRLRETAPSFGLEHEASAPYRVTSSPTFTVEAMDVASGLAQAGDRFYNRGMAVPWFAIMIQALALTPSELFTRFAEWITTRDGEGGDDIVALQQAFISAQLRHCQREAWVPLATDIITYFGRLEAMAEVGDRVTFAHDPFEVVECLESGMTDLADLHNHLPTNPCVVTLCRDETASSGLSFTVTPVAE